MKIIEYDAFLAIEYAKKWAKSRNPNYYDFSLIGGDCTNFCSQCLYSSCKVFNYTKNLGWYYISPTNRAPAFTGVEEFYTFLISNQNGVGDKSGPFAKEIDLTDISVGDFIQLRRADFRFYHTLIVTDIKQGVPLVSAHTFDALDKPLFNYSFEKLRCIKILGARIP